jgi:hypothetical protein
MQPPHMNHTLIADLEILGFFFFLTDAALTVFPQDPLPST